MWHTKRRRRQSNWIDPLHVPELFNDYGVDVRVGGLPLQGSKRFWHPFVNVYIAVVEVE